MFYFCGLMVMGSLNVYLGWGVLGCNFFGSMF